MRRVTSVKTLQGYRLDLTFDDGFRGMVDLSDLADKGVFAIWNAPGSFAQVRIGSSGELTWNDQVDLCPDALYLKATGKKADELFPSIQREKAHA